MKRLGAVMGAMVLSACGPVEVRLDENNGVPNIKGQTEVTLGANFQCGMAVGGSGVTVQTRVVSGGCEFTFDDTIEVLTADSYRDIPDLQGTTNLVKRVEMTVKKLDFLDATTNTKLDLQTRITSAEFVVNGQQVLDKAKLASLPATITLSGTALDQLKSKVDARQPASVSLKAIAVLPTTPAPPEKLKLDYDAQPAVVLGPKDVKLF